MEAVLVELLQRLDAIIRDHYEDVDTVTREALWEVLYHGFLKPSRNYQPPRSFAIRTEAADKLVCETMAWFLIVAHQAAQQDGLDTFHKRLNAWQNPDVRLRSGRDLQSFFGWCGPDWFDESGNRNY